MQSILDQTTPPVLQTNEQTFLGDVIEGLSQQTKSLPCKYFYDARGSVLFDEICELPEYYPTRTEVGIMREYAAQMTTMLGERCMLIEYGSGSSVKTRFLLDRAPNMTTYVPVDISHEHLHATATTLRTMYPEIEVLPVSADYTRPFALPSSRFDATHAAIYFPGSTIGNFHPSEAAAFLSSMAEISGKGGGLLIGVDLRKDVRILEAAYNDSAGVTAAFNRNILLRINAELGGTFEPDQFRHRAHFDDHIGRIEMHLISDCAQEIWIGSSMFRFEEGESIWTENSYKYTIPGFASLAESAGWKVNKVWTDPLEWFSVQYLTAL